ncbi:MAG TPA: PKD domain-containing protein [Methanoregula sp.]|nr:PKD domain-containing protein [Methanoregula sp.]
MIERETRTVLRILLFLVITSVIFSATTHAAGIETLISTHDNGFSHRLPKISSERIVWQDQDPTANYGIIYLYNLTSGIETQVTDNTSYATNPAIYGDYIAYTDCDSDSSCPTSAIYFYNIATGTRTQISSGVSWQDFPSVYNNRIVWLDSDQNPTSQIYVNGTSPGDETRVNATDSYQLNPAIYGSSVVWQDDRDGNNNIFLADLVSHQVTRITDDSNEQLNPQIFDNKIIWQDNRNGNDEIFINGTVPGDEYNLTPDEPAINHQNPSVSGNWVAWTQENTTHPLNRDLIVNDTSTYQKIPIALDRYNLITAQISYSQTEPHYRIVWSEQDSGGNNTIHLYSSSSPGTCPVAGFVNNFAGGSAPVTVHFSDTSSQSPSNPITHWLWNFGDGSNSTLENPDHTFAANQAYDVSLTVSNPYCRNAATVTNSVVVGKPLADFIASPTSDIVPVTITFTDTSLGSPTQWNWSFGDGAWTNGTTQNPTHTYTSPGTYTVSLTASNGYGSTTKTRSGYITALSGANEIADTSINGITIQNSGSRQYLIFDYATLSDWSFNPNTSALEFTPPSDRGFGNITIFTTDPGGFLVNPANSTILGNISSVRMDSKNIVPQGFSAATGGPFASINYSVTLSAYPENALLSTKVWEGATSSDATLFNYIATASHYSGTNGTAYTTKIVKTNFPTGGTAHLHMSLNASWVASKPQGRNEVYLERISDDGLYGQIIPTRFLIHNSTENLDYFDADSPEGLSTFGLSFVEGSGNPLQILALTVTSHISEEDNTGSVDTKKPTGTVTVNASVQPTGIAPVIIDPGKTASLYINTKTGVITQTTTLVSTDNRTTLTINKGIVAKDQAGNVLPAITIRNIPQVSLPSIPQDLTGSFSGIAFELGPDGATFSSALSLSILFPEAQWNTEYSLKGYDPVTENWVDLPTAYSPKNSTITSSVSHFCYFALFSVANKPTVNHQPMQGNQIAPSASPAVQSPPTTAINIFINMILWVFQLIIKNLIVLVVAALIILLLYYLGRKKRMDRIRYLM